MTSEQIKVYQEMVHNEEKRRELIKAFVDFYRAPQPLRCIDGGLPMTAKPLGWWRPELTLIKGGKD